MPLTNSSQVLLRNSELIIADSPLFINLPEDGFIDAYFTLQPDAKISCFNNNFLDYQAIQEKHGAKPAQPPLRDEQWNHDDDAEGCNFAGASARKASALVFEDDDLCWKASHKQIRV